MQQPGWTWCQNCQGLFFAPNGAGACPAGGSHAGGGHYVLVRDADPAEHPHGQDGWNWCSKCQALFFGGNSSTAAAAGPCPAGDVHAGAGNYTLDTESSDTPADQQRGWRWCGKCQSLFFGDPAAPNSDNGHCPGGDTHFGGGSGSYVLTDTDLDPAVPAPAAPAVAPATATATATATARPVTAPLTVQPELLSSALAPMKFENLIVLGTLVQAEPLFAPDQEQAIDADGTATITDLNGGRWCQLGSWLGFPAQVATAVWQCRSQQLTITLPSVRVGVQVLPFLDGSPTASLALPAGPPLTLSPVVDGSQLRLLASFGADAAGRASYDAAIGALSKPGGAALTLANSHQITVQVPGTAPAPDPRPIPVPPPVPRPIPRPIPDPEPPERFPQSGFGNGGILGRRPVLAELQRQNLQLAAQFVPQEATASAQAVRLQPAALLAQQANTINSADLSQLILTERPFPGRVFIPTHPSGPSKHTATFSQQGTGMLNWKPQSDVASFPDIPRQAAGGWLQITPSVGANTLHCLPGGRPELFYYLPTAYKLGFHAGSDPADLPALPFRVTMARDSAGEITITVSMTAMPYLSDADRSALRDYLLQHVLLNTQPYVELEAASGLSATFQADFLSAGSPVASSSIQYQLAGATSSDLLQIQFTMDELDYGLLVPMLQRGITGSVVLADEHVSVAIPVTLQLDDVITNALAVTALPVPDPAPDPYTGAVTVTNRLAYPVQVGRLGVDLVYTGSESDIIFDAEELSLLAAPLQVPASATSSPQSYTPTLSIWNDTFVVPGVVSVIGPSPADWVAQVNRDPSLQPSKVTVTLSPDVPAAHLADIRSLTVSVFTAGSSTPRQPALEVAPDSSAPLELDLTLTELAGGLDLRTGFFLEFTSRFQDDTRSLPQRIGLDLTRRAVDLVALWEPPGATYYIDADTTVGPVTREVAGQVIETLRSAGKTWEVRAVAPAATPPAG